MDQTNNNGREHPQGCMCGGCKGGMYGGYRHGGMFRVLRWILAIILISWVFSIGMRVGEFKAEVMGQGMYRMHVPMMYGYYGAVPATTVVPSTTATTK